MSFKNKDALARHGGAAYQLRKVLRDGKYDHFVEVGCAKCPAKVELHQGNNTDTTDPDLLRKRMTGKGWTFHPYKARAILCPKCQRTSEEREVVEHYEPKEDAMPSKPTLVVAEMAQTQPPQVGPRTGLTSEERFKVRQLLDTHFDDKVGAYLNNYSDQKIGEDVDVPWKLVFDLREMAYGPIREDPKLVAFRNDLSRMERELAELKMKFLAFSKGTK